MAQGKGNGVRVRWKRKVRGEIYREVGPSMERKYGTDATIKKSDGV